MTNSRFDPAQPSVLIALIVVQSICAAIFLGDIIADLLMPGAMNTEGRHAAIEAIATFGLITASKPAETPAKPKPKPAKPSAAPVRPEPASMSASLFDDPTSLDLPQDLT